MPSALRRTGRGNDHLRDSDRARMDADRSRGRALEHLEGAGGVHVDRDLGPNLILGIGAGRGRILALHLAAAAPIALERIIRVLDVRASASLAPRFERGLSMAGPLFGSAPAWEVIAVVSKSASASAPTIRTAVETIRRDQPFTMSSAVAPCFIFG